ncbi:ribose 5-phosphate isomerase B [Mycoplasma phocimorsus]|uniref:ribose 5-phosphate isomerase B n=1 Tax=Mycoplasma phocimorsus TaxID=3045839 RepID=UPI0024C0974E|nr:ribose 5-phosphate isomerase B [Mycoplasma phocimorsus]MDJ1649164.1 ribose 5-phosphate isomerase B [Mycoplasma phocimorsus]
MKAVIASDHAAFELKTEIIDYLKEKGYEVVDLGPITNEPTSYSLQGHKLAHYVLENQEDLAIGMCGTGLGISYALNRHKGIRAARCTSEQDAMLAKKHNDANILVIGGRISSICDARKMIEAFIHTEFEGGRHIQRIKQIEEN